MPVVDLAAPAGPPPPGGPFRRGGARAIVGLAVLGQGLGTLEVAAVGCVVIASAAAARWA